MPEIEPWSFGCPAGSLVISTVVYWYNCTLSPPRRPYCELHSLFVLYVQIILGVVAAISILLPALSDLAGHTDVVDYSEGSGGRLSWEQYQNHCHQPAWERSSVALVQLRCSHLAGTPVGWDGYVTDVRIRSISNTLEAVFSRWICTCYYYGCQ